jgi:hypothetical protein
LVSPGRPAMKIPRRRFLRLVGSIAALSAGTDNGIAHNFPARPITMIGPSGTVIFYASGRLSSPKTAKAKLGPNDWLYVEIGYHFHIATGAISKNKKQPVRPRLYAHFNGGTGDGGYTETNYLKSFPTESEALKKLHQCVKDARQEALGSLRGPYREVLRNFKIPPM